MEFSEQIETELRKIKNTEFNNDIKEDLKNIILQLKKTDSHYKITKIENSFVKNFADISCNKSYRWNFEDLIPIARILIESGTLDGTASEGILAAISSHVGFDSDNFDMKALQVAMSTFASPSRHLSLRIKAMSWIFDLASSKSSNVQQVAIATLYQSIGLIMYNIQNDNRNTPNNEPKNNEKWTVRLIFIILTDILSSLIGESPLVFKQLEKSNKTTLYYKLVKYILDNYITDLLMYEKQFNDVIVKLILFINAQKDASLYTFFVPHVVFVLKKTNEEQAKQIVDKLFILLKENPFIFNTLNAIIMCDTSALFNVIDEEKTVCLRKEAAKYFVENYKEDSTINMNVVSQESYKIEDYNSFNTSVNTILASCVSIIFQQIHQCIKHLDYFDELFDTFFEVWEKVIKTTNSQITMPEATKISRVAVKIAVVRGNKEQSNRIIETLCDLARPNENKQLQYRGVIALRSIIKLLKALTYRIRYSWEDMFETISECYSVALLKESQHNQLSTLISPKEIDFSKHLKNEPFKEKFSFFLDLALKEYNTEQIPNFWPHEYLFVMLFNNMQRVDIIADDLFKYLEFLLECESEKRREFATNKLFDILREFVSNKELGSIRKRLFELILMTANSKFKDVSLNFFTLFLTFIKDSGSCIANDEWITVFNVFRAIFVQKYEENIENGFNALSLICKGYIKHIDTKIMNELTSTVNLFIVQTLNIETSVGAIKLFADIGSSLLPVNETVEINVWKFIFTVLYENTKDKRKMIRTEIMETFKILIATLQNNFPDELRFYITDFLLKPIFEHISSEVNKSVNGVTDADEYILALSKGINCLGYLKNYGNLISTIIVTIEKLTQKVKSTQELTKSIRCYLLLIECSDKEAICEITNSVYNVINRFFKDNNFKFMKNTAPIIAEMFKIITNNLDDDEFQIWINILNMFCIYKLDTKSINESTNLILDSLVNTDSLSVEKLSVIVKMIKDLIKINNSNLSAKCFDVLYTIYSDLFNESNREICLSMILPTFQQSLKNNEYCYSCFIKVINLPVNLKTLLKDDRNVKRLVDIGRRFPVIEKIVLSHISKYMDCISQHALPLVVHIVSNSPELYIAFISDFCAKGVSEEKIKFAKEMKKVFFDEIKEMISLILDEEKSLGSVLPNKCYQCISTFLPKFIEIETEESIFEIDGCGEKGHLFMLVNDMVRLSESKNREIRTIAQKVITAVNNKILSY